MPKRFVPLLIGEDAPPLRPPPASTLRANAKRKSVRKPKRVTKRATKRPSKRSSKSDFEHLRVRSPSSFKASTFKTIPWAWVPSYEQAFVRKKLGLRSIPKGAKAISGTFKPGAKKDRIPGKKVAFYAHGVQAFLLPIKGGKSAKSPRGTPRLSKKRAQKVVKRARRNPAGTTSRGEAFAHHHVRPVTSFVPGSYRTVKPSHVVPREMAAAKRKAHMRRLPPGSEVVVGKFRKSARGRTIGKRVGPLEWGIVKILTPNRANGRTRKNDCIGVHTHRDARGAAKPMRPNPGRLAILANPLPKAVDECANAMRGERRKRFLAYYVSLKPGDQRRLVKGLQLYKRRHKVPCTEFSLVRSQGTKPPIEVGIGKALAVEYSANKGYHKSAKRGTPWRHEFENDQELVTDENGRNLRVADRPGAKRKTVTTDYIYH